MNPGVKLATFFPEEDLKRKCAVFGAGPFHTEARTNAHVEICNSDGLAVAQCSWSTSADSRAAVLCALLNLALGHEPGRMFTD